ncbi:MAG: Vacuolar protein sorting-associated protein 62 [Caeruleum heppii]|nr:MAG: Vacuolar protein sorting-associated protein 62 [Caeruleum heppii]
MSYCSRVLLAVLSLGVSAFLLIPSDLQWTSNLPFHAVISGRYSSGRSGYHHDSTIKTSAERTDQRTNKTKELGDIPQYVLDHAPLVHLYSGEQFWPCDIREHLQHITPNLNYTPLQAKSHHEKLTDLDELNQWDGGRFVYLKSDDNVEERPSWLGGEKINPTDPDDDDDDDGCTALGCDGKKQGQQQPLRAPPKPTRGRRSPAPAVLVVVEKEDGIVDAFWFYFYSYNLGNIVLNLRWGNHVGDWEHSLVRFQHGIPKSVFLSEHYFGQAYTYDAVEKAGRRPIMYSAVGTHAMYATPAVHPYILPLGLLHDVTDRGPLWDPLLNAHTYTYDWRSDHLRSGNVTPTAPLEWFYFAGHWGDRTYPLSDPRQYTFAGQYHYVSGPLGPRFKQLGRREICQGRGECVIKDFLDDDDGIRGWVGGGEDEAPFEDDGKVNGAFSEFAG